MPSSSQKEPEPMPDPHEVSSSKCKEWQQGITKSMRNQFVGKLVGRLFLTSKLAQKEGHQIQHQIAIAQQLEREIFAVANGREEYRRQVSERVQQTLGKREDQSRFGASTTARWVPGEETLQPGANLKIQQKYKARDLSPQKTDEDTNEFQAVVLRPVWEKLQESEDSLPFRAPVDPLLLGIPNYLESIKKLVNLTDICGKLNRCEYKNVRDFCDDMWTMFDNAWKYNLKTSVVYAYSTRLSERFVKEMDPVMKGLGYDSCYKPSFTTPAYWPSESFLTSSRPPMSSSSELENPMKINSEPTDRPHEESSAPTISQKPQILQQPLSEQFQRMGDGLSHSPQQQQQQHVTDQLNDKRKLLRQQLVLLLHADECKQTENCTVPHCSMMSEVLEHQHKCKEGIDCKYDHCHSSREILSHWKNCKTLSCEMCTPVWDAQRIANIEESRTGFRVIHPHNPILIEGGVFGPDSGGRTMLAGLKRTGILPYSPLCSPFKKAYTESQNSEKDDKGIVDGDEIHLREFEKEHQHFSFKAQLFEDSGDELEIVDELEAV